MVAGAAAAILAGAPAPSPAADLALRYSTFVAPISPVATGALHLSLGLPAGEMGVTFDAARYSLGVYTLTGGVRTMGRHCPGTSLYAQVVAGLAWVPGETPIGLVQPGVGVDFGSRGRAAFRVQVDWPVVTLYGILLWPQVSVGVVLRPKP
jgi:hypothetical protein